MACMQCEELTRVEILERFKKRELHVPSADKMPIDQLEQIYKEFIVPQPRRERRDRMSIAADTPRKPIIELPMQLEHQSRRIEVVSVIRQKRSHYTDCQIPHRCTSKRIKVEQHR